jgi:exosortase/archaeosortase family protein
VDQSHDEPVPIVKNIIALSLVFIIAQTFDETGFVSDLSRQGLVGFANLLGLASMDRGYEIVLGSLVVPWTDDCSGINSLILLGALSLWINRNNPFSIFSVTRLLLVLPLALFVNILRVASIATYRYVYYPEWETPQLHYFIGFFWLLPCLPLLVKNFTQKPLGFWINTLYLSTLLSLLAPLMANPGGIIVVICALLIMLQNGYQPLQGARRLLVVPWVIAGVAIAISVSESLWIPWLLLAPSFVNINQFKTFSAYPVLAGTVTLITLNSDAQIVVCGFIAVHIIVLFLKSSQPSTTIDPEPHIARGLAAGITLLLAFPFILPSLVERDHKFTPPPMGVLAKKVEFNSYEIKVPGQAADIASFWYGPFGDGRHHSLISCMEFRGVTLTQHEDHDAVYTGDDKWMVEYFIYEGELIDNYYSYLLASVFSFGDPGVHLILEVPEDEMTPAYFKQQSIELAQQIAVLHEQRQAKFNRTENLVVSK